MTVSSKTYWVSESVWAVGSDQPASCLLSAELDWGGRLLLRLSKLIPQPWAKLLICFGFQVEPNTKVFPAVFLQPTSTSLFQFELGKLKVFICLFD